MRSQATVRLLLPFVAVLVVVADDTEKGAKTTNGAAVKTEEDDTVPGKCCYSGPSDCDRPSDWCSKNQARCEACAGNFQPESGKKERNTHASSVVLADAVANTLDADNQTIAAEHVGKCCYYKGCAGTDCDGPFDSCSKSEDDCGSCSGSFCPLSKEDREKLAKEEAAKIKKEKEKKEKQKEEAAKNKKEKEKKEQQMEHMKKEDKEKKRNGGSVDPTIALVAEDETSSPTINLVAAKAPAPAPESAQDVEVEKLASQDMHKCCYYKGCAGTDCDGPFDSCSKSGNHCKGCSGHFCPVTKSDLKKLAQEAIAKKKKKEEKIHEEEEKKKEQHEKKLAKEKAEGAKGVGADKPLKSLTLEEMQADANSSAPSLAGVALTALFLMSVLAISLSIGFRRCTGLVWVDGDEQAPGREHLLA